MVEQGADGTFIHMNKGTCSHAVSFKLDENNCIHDVVFDGGCPGNVKAISKLIEGLPAQNVIDIVDGNICGNRGTSCTDQLAQGLKEALEA